MKFLQISPKKYFWPFILKKRPEEVVIFYLRPKEQIFAIPREVGTYR